MQNSSQYAEQNQWPTVPIAVKTLERFTATKRVHMTMMLMAYAGPNKLIDQNASELEC